MHHLDIAMNLGNPDFLPGKSGLTHGYYPAFNVMENGRFTRWFNSFSEVKSFNETYQYQDGAPGNPHWNPNEAETGYYNTEHHVMLQIGIRRGIPNAQQAADRLARVLGHAEDLNGRAGYAITFSATPSTTTGLPKTPSNVRIVP